MKILLYLILIAAFAVFGYYLYLIYSGKRLASLLGSKDRFIWTGLKNVTDDQSPLSGRQNTIFVDQENFVLSELSINDIHTALTEEGQLEHALTIPFPRIVAFDYIRSVKDSNIVIRILSSLFNAIFKKNDYRILLRYIGENYEQKQITLRANSMDAYDFEMTFADFDNRIYSGKVEYEAQQSLSGSNNLPRENTAISEPKVAKATIRKSKQELEKEIEEETRKQQSSKKPKRSFQEFIPKSFQKKKEPEQPAAPAPPIEQPEMIDSSNAKDVSDDFEHQQIKKEAKSDLVNQDFLVVAPRKKSQRSKRSLEVEDLKELREKKK